MKKLSKLTGCFILLLTASIAMPAFASPDWFKPMPGFRIVGNIYYVGSRDLASYLITTSQGNILINTSYDANIPLIKKSIKDLGFNYNDTKIILISQAHADHASASAAIQKETHAKYMVMQQDIPAVKSGGKSDFLFGGDPEQWYQVAKVDRVLHDGDQVKLGDTVLTAHLTAGHTKGCTTWTTNVLDNGKSYNVVVVGGVTINPGTKLIDNPQYKTILSDYHHMWKELKSLPCDVFLGAHGVYFNMLDKYSQMKVRQSNPFIDPVGYRHFINKSENDFQSELLKQRSELKK